MKKMKHVFLMVLIFQMILPLVNAQKYEVSINAGPNLTYIPDFDNLIVIANDGMAVPGIISPSNSVSPLLLSESQSLTNAKSGVFVDLEFWVKLNDKWQWSISTGVNQFRYDYDTYVETEGIQSGYLGDLSSDYGSTNLFYINLNPSNVSLSLFNRFRIQCGPTFNILLKSKYNNALIFYTPGHEGEMSINYIEKVYFESIAEMKKILYGIHLRTSYNIFRGFDVFISGQHYFNSVYSESDYLSKTQPFQIQAGISYVIWKSGKNPS